jgi:hypothetical protein
MDVFGEERHSGDVDTEDDRRADPDEVDDTADTDAGVKTLEVDEKDESCADMECCCCCCCWWRWWNFVTENGMGDAKCEVVEDVCGADANSFALACARE